MKIVSATERTFSSKLLSISPNAKPNVNGTMFRNATIEFANANAELVVRPAIVYDNNFNYGMQVGMEYLSTATKTADGCIITVSHLINAPKATEEDFGF